MNYLIGFILWWIMVGIIYVGVYLYRKKTKKHNYLSWKYVQMITYILSMLLGYIVVFMFSQLWNDYKWKCSALAGTIILITVVKIVRCFWNSIWKTNNRNIELTEGELQWCNTISIAGMVALGIVFFIQYKVSDFFEISSLAVSIWVGSYISMQKVQGRNSIKDVKADLIDTFKIENRGFLCFGIIFMILFVTIVSLHLHELLLIVSNRYAVGFSIGGILFIGSILFRMILKKKIIPKETKKIINHDEKDNRGAGGPVLRFSTK